MHDDAAAEEHALQLSEQGVHTPELLKYPAGQASMHVLKESKSGLTHDKHEVAVPSVHVAHEPSHAAHTRSELAYCPDAHDDAHE